MLSSDSQTPESPLPGFPPSLGKLSQWSAFTVVRNPKSIPLGDYVDNDPAIVNQRWTRWHLKDTQKGPKVVEVKHAIIYPQNSQKLPCKAHHLLIVRDVLSGEVKLFLSNAPKKDNGRDALKGCVFAMAC